MVILTTSSQLDASPPTPAPAFGVRFRAMIAAEWHRRVRIRRCDRLVGALFMPTPATRSADIVAA